MDFLFGLAFILAFIVILIPIILIKNRSDKKGKFKLQKVENDTLKNALLERRPELNEPFIQLECKGFTKEDTVKDQRFLSEYPLGKDIQYNGNIFEIVDVVKVFNTNLMVKSYGTKILAGSSGMKNQDTSKMKDGNLLACKWIVTIK
ncbi:hypothetical protein [Culicoidibacter larvae]|uniref:Uncharacterized protein n=1 Tax=Culicoidibacter larvae TaxID=2579976 RepID=A0A5R8QDW4_9FIRM|nr:hypothetical protein [Culicoidibacter larvae]TLG75384.1 hypothetical protein FEZ08_04870 [Culicoidibacter larvae]